jgi:hypothetical protein
MMRNFVCTRKTREIVIIDEKSGNSSRARNKFSDPFGPRNENSNVLEPRTKAKWRARNANRGARRDKKFKFNEIHDFACASSAVFTYLCPREARMMLNELCNRATFDFQLTSADRRPV